MYHRFILCLFFSLTACGLPPQLDEPWRGNVLDQERDQSAPPITPPNTGADAGPVASDASVLCGNRQRDPGEECDPSEPGSFPCGGDCRFLDCGTDGPTGAQGDPSCAELAEDAGDDNWRCIRIPGRSICAPPEDEDIPDFLEKAFGRCLDQGAPIMVGDEEVRCGEDRNCQEQFGDHTNCQFDVPDEFRGLCVANGFEPNEYWRPSETAILLGWTVEMPGEEAQCYPMACDSGEDGKPEEFCEAIQSDAFRQIMPRTTCVGDLALDDGQRHGPNNEFPVEDQICVLVECSPQENEEDNRNEFCIQHYRIEDATCTDDGYCAARSEDLILQNIIFEEGLERRCAETCHEDGAPGPDPMLLCHTQSREDDGELTVGCSRCNRDGDCPSGFVCDHQQNGQEGFCRAACGGNFDCPSAGGPTECRNGRCYPGGGPNPPGDPMLRTCRDSNACPQGEHCRPGSEDEDGICMPETCGRDQDCPEPFLCIHGGICELPAIHHICEPNDLDEDFCGDYLACRDLEDPFRPICVSDLYCDRDNLCPATLHCVLNQCVGRGGGCENAAVGQGTSRAGLRICDIPDRDLPQTCNPGDAQQPEDCLECSPIQWRAQDDPSDDHGVCVEEECQSPRDCPWGQICLLDREICIPETLCADFLPLGPAHADHEPPPPTRLCPEGLFCAPRRVAVGEESQTCLAQSSCNGDQDCDQSPQAICVNHQCMSPGICHDGINQDGVCLPIQNDDLNGSLVFNGETEDDHSIINLNSSLQTQIDGPRDADAFVFTAPAPGSYRFGTRNAHRGEGQLWGGTGDFNTICFLSVSQSQMTHWNDDPPEHDHHEAENTHCELEVGMRANDQAFLLVHAHDLWDDWGDVVPHFEVYVECSEDGGCGQGDDHGDVGDPTHIGNLEEWNGMSVNGEINHFNDVDAFTFTALHDGRASIGLDQAPSHLYLEVRAAGDGNPILNSCEVAAASNICSAVVEVSNGSLYSVSVRGLNGATGTYRLFGRQGN